MPDTTEAFAPVVILPRIHATSKRHALQQLCEALAETAKLDQRSVYDAVLLRERLAGTGVGEGVAIPHARVAGLNGAIGLFARLDPPLDFEALDGRPADLVYLLLAPQGRGADHLKALARVSRFLRRAEIREKLRHARCLDGLMSVFEAAPQIDAA
jgi:nitrogen PTS system EIIA component